MKVLRWIVVVVGGAAGACLFITALRHSHSGELAGALGSLIGGAVGAGGAVWAVFLLLRQQGKEEAVKVETAVQTEITTLVKYVIGAIEICKQIKAGITHVPEHEAEYIVKNFAADPVIYTAVADRIGMLSHPQATTEFYMRLAETKAMVEALARKAASSYATPNVQFVRPDFAEKIAESLITALQLARSVIADDISHADKQVLGEWVRTTTVGQIHECLEAAKVAFPNSEALKEQVNPG
jgi:hypothetical protein